MWILNLQFWIVHVNRPDFWKNIPIDMVLFFSHDVRGKGDRDDTICQCFVIRESDTDIVVRKAADVSSGVVVLEQYGAYLSLEAFVKCIKFTIG